MNDREIRTESLFGDVPPYLKEIFEESGYPWEIIGKIPETAKKLVEKGIPGFTEIRPGILVGKNVKIYETATIEPPAVIGENSLVRPGAFIRGNVITGKNCVIGNSSELKNCVLLDGVQAPHYNYIGDSVLGNGAHMGAGSICSNLKADRSEVSVKGEILYRTGLKKFGAVLADGADIGCGAVLNPGTVIGRNTNVYPLVSVRGTVGGGRIVKAAGNVAVKEERKRCAE